MARISLQIKNVGSLLLAAGASISSAVSVRRFFEHGNWTVPAGFLVVFLGCQLALLFVESKEEEELSLLRTQRLDRSRHAIAENERLSQQIQQCIESGDLEAALKWQKTRRKLNE